MAFDPNQPFTIVQEEVAFDPTKPFSIVSSEAPAIEKESGFLRQVADIPLKVAQGGISSVKSFTDLFGADNAMSKELAGYEKWVGSLVSAESKKDDEEIARILKDAENKGVYDKVIAGLQAFSKAPLEMTAQSGGYMIPQLAAGVLGKAAQFTKAGIIGTQAAIGFAQGAGQAKGDIYESTLDYLRKQGVPENVANDKAIEAQATLGKNLDQILLSAIGNALTSSTGAEAIATRILIKQGKEATGGAIKGFLKGVAAESPLEAIQSAQQEVAKNVAIQREGGDVPTFKGAIESATTGAVAGAFIGGPLGAFEAMSPEQKAEIEITKEANRKARDLEAPDTATQAIAAAITNLERGIDNKRKDLDVLESTSPEAAKLRLDIAADQKILAQSKEQANKLGLSETITEAEKQQIELAKQIAAPEVVAVAEAATPAPVEQVVTPPVEVAPAPKTREELVSELEKREAGKDRLQELTSAGELLTEESDILDDILGIDPNSKESENLSNREKIARLTPEQRKEYGNRFSSLVSQRLTITPAPTIAEPAPVEPITPAPVTEQAAPAEAPAPEVAPVVAIDTSADTYTSGMSSMDKGRITKVLNKPVRFNNLTLPVVEHIQRNIDNGATIVSRSVRQVLTPKRKAELQKESDDLFKKVAGAKRDESNPEWVRYMEVRKAISDNAENVIEENLTMPNGDIMRLGVTEMRFAKWATKQKSKPTPAVSETITEPVERDVTKPEQMTPQEWKASRKKAEGNIYSGAVSEYQQKGGINNAIKQLAPVSVRAVDEYGIKIPKGYTKQGELYLYQPTTGKPKLGEKGGVLIPSREDFIQAGQNIYEKGMEFGTWAKQMIQQFGDVVREFLGDVWQAVSGAPAKLNELMGYLPGKGEAGSVNLGSGKPATESKNALELIRGNYGELSDMINKIIDSNQKIADALQKIPVELTSSNSFDGETVRISKSFSGLKLVDAINHEITHSFLAVALREIPSFREAINSIRLDAIERAKFSNDISFRGAVILISEAQSLSRGLIYTKKDTENLSQYMIRNTNGLMYLWNLDKTNPPFTYEIFETAYALASNDEFLAHLMSDKRFRDELKTYKVFTPDNRNLFQKFIDSIKGLFQKLTKVEKTVLDKAMEQVERVVQLPEYNPRPIEGLAEMLAKYEQGDAPIEPEAETITEAMGQGLDIGKEDNMPINNKIESHIKNFAFVRGFFESASDRLRRAGFKKLATAIDDYYDQAQRRLGFANKILLPAFDEYAKQSKANKKKIDEEVKMFYAAQENKRDTAEFFDELNPITQKIVTAWQKFGEESGKDNQRIGIKVFDRGLKRFRPIGRVDKFFPRRLLPKYDRALMEPDKYQKEYNEIVAALIEAKRIDKPEDAERYIANYKGTGTKNDYFSGIESARGKALPEELYDYSMQVMTDYVARWSQHASRIEQFGQKLGENSMTLWDRSRASTRDRRTIDYITAAQERVEGYFPNDPFQKGMAALNIWASGLQLGNPASATMNMVGGTTLNAMIGQPGAASSYVESLVELRKLGSNLQDAREKGIISRDLMNIVGDHQEVLDQNGIAKAGQKTADFLLKWSGFTPVEQMVRTQSLIIGKSFLRKTLSSYSQNPDSLFSKQASTWLSRNNFDIDKLLVEQGSGPETDKLMRYFATASQGGYTISQTPIFIDTPIGKFLFKYQKFSTQVMRQAWKNTFEPAWKAVTFKGETMQLPSETRQLLYRLRLAEAREIGDNRKISLDEIPQKVSKAEAKALTLIPVMMWLASAYIGGEAILRLRDVLFGVMMKGPDYEDILKALEDDEDDDELYLGLQRAWYNLIGIGALGLIGNYGQFFMDWQDRERVKNPLDPPALSLVKETATLIQNVADQGTITKGDINNYLNRMSSMYRVSQKLYQTSASGLGFSDAPTVAEEMYRREVADINKYARRWAESAGLEYRTKRPMDIAPSKMTPINRKISSYLQRNDPVGASAYAKEYLKTLPKDARKNAIQSMESGARNRQPLRLGDGPMDEAEKRAFLKWAKTKMSPEKYASIEKLTKQYESNRKKFLMRLPNR